MRVGIKLDIGFSESEVCRELYGDRDILAFLTELGVEAAETPIRPETDGTALLDHVRRCCAAGLRMSFHPYTERKPSNPAHFSMDEGNLCREVHERFFSLAAKTARIQNAETIVNIHPAAGVEEDDRRDLIDQSVRFFDWAREWCSEHAPAVRPLVELLIRPNPDETIQRIGDCYPELLEIVERAGVDASWDLGHAFMNARRFGDPLAPPAELFGRIVHVHCHDADQNDHQPLIFGNVPWQRFLEELAATGFNGTVILEIPPRHFLAAGGLDTLTRSFKLLISYVEKIRK